MKKKKLKKKASPKKEKEQFNEGRGMLLLAFSLVLLLSLVSYAYHPAPKYILGIVGYHIGWILHALMGVSAYFVFVFMSWIGWRQLFSRPVNHLFAKGCYFFLFTFSLSMLLSMVEFNFPRVATFLGHLFYPSLWEAKMQIHLGGAPAYFLYSDLPHANLHTVVNAVGVAIIFSFTLITSLMFLMKVRPVDLLNGMIRSYLWIKAQFPERAPSEPLMAFAKSYPEASPSRVMATISPAAVIEPVPPPSRFVKLNAPMEAQPGDKDKARQEMLEIEPEVNLKIRPSISRKTQSDLMPSFPFDLNTPAPAGKLVIGESEPPHSPSVSSAPSFTTQTKDPIQDAKTQLQQKAVTPKTKRENALDAQQVHNGDFTRFKLPGNNLLSTPKKIDQNSLKSGLKRQAEVLEETLCSFGIEAKVGQINCGPTINSFEVHPAIGVKVQKIKALDNDIALNMEAKSIRIIAPIPGKAAVGIEIPNVCPQEVGFKDMLAAYQQSGRKFFIPILLGQTVNGEYVMSDLTKMPHAIIAGATGSGKSVCINTIVMSIVMNAKPDEVRMIMVDPKKVELTPYTNLPHMLAPVITESVEACSALKWLVKEMESRYEILKLVGQRNIQGFNSRTINEEQEKGFGKELPKKMYYIVAIIDELADLMMVAGNEIETPIARIAQMARAVGIHLILATQRPSREVITGLIKANFPTRISFKVASRVNSQIILDEVGAEALLGNGDLLFLPPGSSHLVRAQGAYIRDEDINAVVKFICDQAPPSYVIQSFDGYGTMAFDDENDDNGDDLFNDAVNIILSTNNASTTFLQRKLKIGYARAASLIDHMEAKGIIGPAEGSKPRKILRPRMADAYDQPELDL